MDKFQDLLTEAAHLKQSQLKKQRKHFQSLPEYLKSGLNYSKKYALLRKQHLLVQMHVSLKLKREGNDNYAVEKYSEAQSKYEEGLSIFRFISAKTYDNMKDEDMIYEQIIVGKENVDDEERLKSHLMGLYLNICSCLTKANRKEDALHSADEALKIKETAKAYYKKAQVYLQFINKDHTDIKLGFYYLNQSYQLSKDASILQHMHHIKQTLDQERTKQKQWFQFMFNHKQNTPTKLQLISKNSENHKSQQVPSILTQNTSNKVINQAKIKQNANQLSKKQYKISDYLSQIKNVNQKEKLNLIQMQVGQKMRQQALNNNEGLKQQQHFERTKEKLTKYLHLSENEWMIQYNEDFVSRVGSKIYSIMQLYGYKEYLGEYRSLLAQCLESKNKTNVEKRTQIFQKYMQWLVSHPIDKIKKYIERYQLQVKWILDTRKYSSKLNIPSNLNQNTIITKQNKEENKYIFLNIQKPKEIDIASEEPQSEQNINEQIVRQTIKDSKFTKISLMVIIAVIVLIGRCFLKYDIL